MKRYSIEIQGDEKRWAFDVWGEPEHAEAWQDDGLEVAELVDVEWIAESEQLARRGSLREIERGR